MQPHPFHHPVDHERDAREVPRILEEPDEEEEHQNLRGKHDDVANAGNDSLHDQVLEHPRGENRGGLCLHESSQTLDRADQRFGPREERLEDPKHHDGKHNQPHDRVSQHAIDALAP
jgi:hypothetical protein